MIDRNNKKLSPQGEARKQAMLSELVGDMKNIHRVRQSRSLFIHSIALIAICACAVWVVSIKYSDAAEFERIVTNIPQGDQQQSAQKTTVVRTIDDDELIALLAEINRPAGVVRSQGRIWLTNKVTDEELGITYEIPAEDPSSM